MQRTDADLWLGWLEFDLNSSHGLPIASVSVSVRRDVVLMYVVDRNIAAIDRERFGDWIRSSVQEFAQDDVKLTQVSGRTYVSIDGGRPFLIADAIVRQLVALL